MRLQKSDHKITEALLRESENLTGPEALRSGAHQSCPGIWNFPTANNLQALGAPHHNCTQEKRKKKISPSAEISAAVESSFPEPADTRKPRGSRRAAAMGGEADASTGGAAGDPQRLKRIGAAAYDYENDARWAGYWSNVLVPPHLASRPDVVDHFKRKFYQRYIVSPRRLLLSPCPDWTRIVLIRLVDGYASALCPLVLYGQMSSICLAWCVCACVVKNQCRERDHDSSTC